MHNLDLVQFWINEIYLSQKFYMWLKTLIDRRYHIECGNGCSNDSQMYSDKADELINFILNIQIPEIDMDLYSTELNISAEEYAMRKVNEVY